MELIEEEKVWRSRGFNHENLGFFAMKAMGI